MNNMEQSNTTDSQKSIDTDNTLLNDNVPFKSIEQLGTADENTSCSEQQSENLVCLEKVPLSNSESTHSTNQDHLVSLVKPAPLVQEDYPTYSAIARNGTRAKPFTQVNTNEHYSFTSTPKQQQAKKHDKPLKKRRVNHQHTSPQYTSYSQHAHNHAITTTPQSSPLRSQQQQQDNNNALKYKKSKGAKYVKQRVNNNIPEKPSFSIRQQLEFMSDEDGNYIKQRLAALHEQMIRDGYKGPIRDDSRLALSWAQGTLPAQWTMDMVSRELVFMQYLYTHTTYDRACKNVVMLLASELKSSDSKLSFGKCMQAAIRHVVPMMKQLYSQTLFPQHVPL
jgi:hypothetical protein